MRLRRIIKNILLVNFIIIVLAAFSAGGILYYQYQQLPPLFSISDYKPLLVSEVFDRKGQKVNELYNQVRVLVPYDKMPPLFVKAFLAVEDDEFFTHGGFNYIAIARAVWVNTMAGSKRQGASTISQQTARSLFLSPEKNYTRKIKEALLTYKMEQHLSKEEILYLYLNQIYLGQGAYGIVAAAETYFRKPLDKLSLAEMAMIAGLAPMPSRMNPVLTPKLAKDRQRHVLRRMVEVGSITQEEADKAVEEVLKVQIKKSYKDVGPYYTEIVRQLLVETLGEDVVLNQGLKIYMGMDLSAQKKAQEVVQEGLRRIDKRRGYRGPKRKIELANTEEVQKFLTSTRDFLFKDKRKYLEIAADGSFPTLKEFKTFHQPVGDGMDNIPPYISVGEIVEGIVVKIDDVANVAYVNFAEGEGVIPLKDMAWARKFNPDLHYGEHLHIKKVSQALLPGDVIDVMVLNKSYSAPVIGKNTSKTNFKNFAHLALEQEPEVESALLSFDLETGDIIAMVGGYDFYKKSKFNRAIQALRQTGSGFKPIVYAAGLDAGLTPATPIMGAPIVYGGQKLQGDENTQTTAASSKDKEEEEAWKPENYDGKFTGDVLMRTALKRSLNTPTIRVLEKATVPFSAEFARRLGIFSPLNMDLSLALGTSGVTVYEMNKAFSVFANKGKRFTPIIIREVKDHAGNTLLKNVSLDERFKEKIAAIEQEFATKREEYPRLVQAHQQKMEQDPKLKPLVNSFYFPDHDQLISPQTAYLMVSMLQGVTMEPDGTGGRAAALGRASGGKTGTTNGYYDAWFLGFTPQISTSVWVGLDTEKTLGRGETGGDSALPIWLPYMQHVHKDLPIATFEPPEGITFATVDKVTGKVSNGADALRVPFRAGTEPGANPQTDQEKDVEDKSFLREDF